MKKVLFLGAPGVGKGTFAKRIAPRLNLRHLSAGELLRGHVKEGSALGRLAKPFLDKGLMVPSEHSVTMMKHEVSKLQASSRVNGYILDGFPRVLEQAQMWSDLALGDGNPELVINISLSRSVLVHKLASRRICGACGDNYNLADIRYGHYDMPPMLPKSEGYATPVARDWKAPIIVLYSVLGVLEERSIEHSPYLPCRFGVMMTLMTSYNID
ncbi:hypothetical protein FOZ60_016121 [Perkinsus olseni]|uniref:Adenylate kinase n=1 Tax=Perkinsus olseni TaxID=32597 RepID=A0A7J6P4T0_PEROL|nr:hypothetical protein FOZ60_016121 [Perkinsus olseni]